MWNIKKKVDLVLITIFLTFVTGVINGQHKAIVRDSIIKYTDSVFVVLKNKNINSNNIEWSSYKDNFLKDVDSFSSLESFLPSFIDVWKDLGSDHTFIIHNEKQYGIEHSLTADDLSTSLIEKYQNEISFEFKVVDQKYGYILIPPINATTIDKEIKKEIQDNYEKISYLTNTNSLEGWIIDLRLNTGGNCWPMIAPLYDFLGDQIIGGWKFKDHIEKFQFKDGKLIEEDKELVSIKIKNNSSLLNVPVAIITGKMTASSGEIVAISFKGRANTIFIGEKSFGRTTTNEMYHLPYGGILLNTEGLDVDRNGGFYDKIFPDIEVIKGDNFQNLSEDKNVKEAINFFKTKV